MCNRNYNEKAYEKHLGHCERKYKEIMFKNRGNAPNSQMGSRGSNQINKNAMGGNMRPNYNTKFGKKQEIIKKINSYFNNNLFNLLINR